MVSAWATRVLSRSGCGCSSGASLRKDTAGGKQGKAMKTLAPVLHSKRTKGGGAGAAGRQAGRQDNMALTVNR